MLAPSPARTILAAAVALGLLGDYLARAPVWGISVGFWGVAFAGRGLALAWSSHSERPAPAGPTPSPWPWLAASFFLGMWAVRDAPQLLAVDLLAALALL